MYKTYYLPFSIHFEQGKNENEIVSLLGDPRKPASIELLDAHQLNQINQIWDQQRALLKKKSLLKTPKQKINTTQAITNTIYQHVYSLNRKAFDGLPIEKQTKLNDFLKTKPATIQKKFKQLQFLKSLAQKKDENKTHFYMVSASWCQSCLEYRVLFESYFKKTQPKDIILHSVYLNDPQEKIFESTFLKEIFPDPEEYSHNSIPRFLLYKKTKTQPILLQEGKALAYVLNKYLLKHRGYLNNNLPQIFNKNKQNQVRQIASEKAPQGRQ